MNHHSLKRFLLKCYKYFSSSHSVSSRHLSQRESFINYYYNFLSIALRHLPKGKNLLVIPINLSSFTISLRYIHLPNGKDLGWNYSFSAILNFALRALLFLFISSLLGVINFPAFLNGTSKFPYISLSGSPSNNPFLMKRFTNLSSNE